MEDKMSAALFQRKTRQKVPCRSQMEYKMSAVILEEDEAESNLPLTNASRVTVIEEKLEEPK